MWRPAPGDVWPPLDPSPQSWLHQNQLLQILLMNHQLKHLLFMFSFTLEIDYNILTFFRRYRYLGSYISSGNEHFSPMRIRIQL